MNVQVYGYENRYEINKNGEIWSLRREKLINNRLYAWAGKKLSPFLDVNGYYYINLGDGNKTKKQPIHRLVLLSFIGNPKEKMVACHIDGNKLNNNLSNLKWGSYAENYADIVKHKTNAIGKKKRKI
jgi:hypothetical protein